MPDMGPAQSVDPGAAIMEEIARSAAYVKYLEGKVRALTEEELVWSDSLELNESRTGGQGGDYGLERTERRAQSNVWWDLLERERKHLATVANAAVRSGLEERRVRIAEKGIDALEEAFVRAIVALGFDPHDSRVRQAIGRELQIAIEGGAMGEGPVRVPAERASAPRVVEGEAGQPLPAPVEF